MRVIYDLSIWEDTYNIILKNIDKKEIDDIVIIYSSEDGVELNKFVKQLKNIKHKSILLNACSKRERLFKLSEKIGEYMYVDSVILFTDEVLRYVAYMWKKLDKDIKFFGK